MELRWQVYARGTDYVAAAFATESSAKDYARWRNEGRRRWVTREVPA